MSVESMITLAPRWIARTTCTTRLGVRLTLNAWIHDMISADGTGIHYHVPSPQRNSIPLPDLEGIRIGILDISPRVRTGHGENMECEAAGER